MGYNAITTENEGFNPFPLRKVLVKSAFLRKFEKEEWNFLDSKRLGPRHRKTQGKDVEWVDPCYYATKKKGFIGCIGIYRTLQRYIVGWIGTMLNDFDIDLSQQIDAAQSLRISCTCRSMFQICWFNQ